MSQEVYRQLAQRLDAIPNGFPATQSGVELRLLAKIFEPDEAALAAVMSQEKESYRAIAERAGVEPRVARRRLKAMARKGLIFAGRGDTPGSGLAFWLMPFAVGVYEEQLPRMDAELAELFEQYYQESQGVFMQDPPIHRVIPVEQAIPFDLEIFPYERAVELVEGAKAWGVRECICRLQQRLVGAGCERPTDNCLVFAPVAGVFAKHGDIRAISREEALQVLAEAAEAGLVHSTGNYRDDHYYICNCCTCCCGVLRGVAEFNIPTAVARSAFWAVVDAGLCIGCGDCLERCQFGALALPDEVCQVDRVRCVGCGLCALVCPVDALSLARRPEEEVPPLPESLKDWQAQRAQERGLGK